MSVNYITREVQQTLKVHIQQVTCDRCREVFRSSAKPEGDWCRLELEETPRGLAAAGRDLCERCAAAVVGFIDAGPDGMLATLMR